VDQPIINFARVSVADTALGTVVRFAHRRTIIDCRTYVRCRLCLYNTSAAEEGDAMLEKRFSYSLDGKTLTMLKLSTGIICTILCPYTRTVRYGVRHSC